MNTKHTLAGSVAAGCSPEEFEEVEQIDLEGDTDSFELLVDDGSDIESVLAPGATARVSLSFPSIFILSLIETDFYGSLNFNQNISPKVFDV